MQINSRAAQKSGPKEGRGRKEAMHSRNMHSTPIPEQTNCAELVPPWLPGSLKVPFTRRVLRARASLSLEVAPSSI